MITVRACPRHYQVAEPVAFGSPAGWYYYGSIRLFEYQRPLLGAGQAEAAAQRSSPQSMHRSKECPALTLRAALLAARKTGVGRRGLVVIGILARQLRK